MTEPLASPPRSSLARPLLLAVLGVAVIGAVAVLAWRQGAESVAPVPLTSAPSASTGAPTAAAPAASRPALPAFDVVRVNPQGDAVIAGRAAPGAEVTISDGTREIGRVTADPHGEWVFVPTAPLPSGARQLSLTARNPDGSEVKGDHSVLLVVPERGGAAVAAAAPPAGTQVAPLVAPSAAPPGSAPAAPPAAAGAAAPGGQGSATASTPASAARSGPLAVLVPSAPGAGGGAPRLLQGPAPAPGSGVLHLGAVDYDDHGDIRFAGTSPPGTTVRVYVDGHAIGDAPVGADGRWELVPRAPLAPGDHRLRLDALGRNGHVTARIALPFHRAEVSADAVAGGRVVVQPGNSLWRLARAAYGKGVRYTIIYQANRSQIRDPNLIYPGQVLSLPASSPASSSRSR